MFDDPDHLDQVLNRMLTKMVYVFKAALARLEMLRFSCCTCCSFHHEPFQLTRAHAVGISIDVHLNQCTLLLSCAAFLGH